MQKRLHSDCYKLYIYQLKLILVPFCVGIIKQKAVNALHLRLMELLHDRVI